MISKVLNHLGRSTVAATCVGVLLAGVLVPRAVLGQGAMGGPPTVTIPGGGGWAIPQSAIPSGPVYPWAGPSSQQPLEDHGGGYYGGWGPQGYGSTCLRARTLSGAVASDDRQVILRFGRDALYRVRLTKACPALLMRGANVAGVTRSTGGMICNAFDVELKVVAGDGSVSRCTGATLRRMTTGQVSSASAPTHP